MPDIFGGVGMFLLYALAFLFVLTIVVSDRAVELRGVEITAR